MAVVVARNREAHAETRGLGCLGGRIKAQGEARGARRQILKRADVRALDEVAFRGGRVLLVLR
jgi:hypothetical protein